MPSAERELRLRRDVPLAPLSTLGVGGRARWFVRASSVEDVERANAWAGEQGAPLFVLGGGSNLVIADAGFDGVVVQIAISGISATPDRTATLIQAGAGEKWDTVVELAVTRGLAGLECLSGIPGSVGGTPIQNVGAYGQEVAETIEGVTVFDRSTGLTASLTAAECRFSYRMSRFKREDAGRFVVCNVTFRLSEGAPTVTYPDVVTYLQREGLSQPQIADVRRAVLAIRRQKGMVLDPVDPDTRSVGSFFMNPIVTPDRYQQLGAGVSDGRVPGFVLPSGDVKVPAAWLIERAGFSRGYQLGAAGLSSKHPLAIINRGGATAADVLALAMRIKREVARRFDVWLRPEPVCVGFGAADVAYLQAAEGEA